MTVGHQDHGRVAMPVAAMLSGAVHELSSPLAPNSQDRPVRRRRRAISSDHEPGGGRTLRGMRSLGPTAVSASIISLFGLRFVGSSVASSAASGDGPSGAGSAAGAAVPSMTFAASPPRAAGM